MERQGFKLPLLIGGNHKPAHTPQSRGRRNYGEAVVHVLDATVLCRSLRSLRATIGKPEFVAQHRASYEKTCAKAHSGRVRSSSRLNCALSDVTSD